MILPSYLSKLLLFCILSLLKKKKGRKKKRTPCLNMPHLLPTWLKNKNSSCWYFMPHHETGLTSHWQRGPCCLVGSQSLSHKPPSCFCQKRFVWPRNEKKTQNTVQVLEASSRLKEKCSGQGTWTIKVPLYSKSKQSLTKNMQPQWAVLRKGEGAGCV